MLAKYQRLEAEGVWRRDADAQRLDVVAAVGDATLTITDVNDVALAHWSLPAIRRTNPGERPAIYSPGDDAPETLEIADAEMIEALGKVLRAVGRRGRRSGRLRRVTVLAILAAVTAVALFWLPGALARYAAAIAPAAARASAGAELLSQIHRLTGAPCAEPSGRMALEALSARLFPDRRVTLAVLPSALTETAHLPGGTILISHRLVEDFEDAETLAGYLLAEDERRLRDDPFEQLVRGTGISGALRLLTTGALADDALERHAQEIVAGRAAALPDAALLQRMRGAELSAAPYFETAGRAPPAAQDWTARPVLSDGDWIALQQICET